MDTSKILSELRTERDRIIQALAALEALDTNTFAGGRPAVTPARPGAKKSGRHISPAGRARIAAAARARWAKLRKSKAAPAGRHMSEAGRKRIAAAAKKMWAERRKKAKAPSARHMSPAARKRLSDLAKARWAKQKKEGKARL
jgi:hypothetical protein